jgi:hypothetical protein
VQGAYNSKESITTNCLDLDPHDLKITLITDLILIRMINLIIFYKNQGHQVNQENHGLDNIFFMNNLLNEIKKKQWFLGVRAEESLFFQPGQIFKHRGDNGRTGLAQFY